MNKTLKKLSRRVALSIAVTACFSPLAQAAELLTEGVFKVGMEVTYPPFESYDSNNNIVGIDPEFAALIAEQLKAKPQLIDTKFTSLILGIGKKYDAVISGMYVTPERQKQADRYPLRPVRRVHYCAEKQRHSAKNGRRTVRREGRSAGGYRLGFQPENALRRVLPEKRQTGH